MRKFLNALCVVALLAGIVACADNKSAEVTVAENCSGHKLPIAYVDTDSLIVLYTYAQEQEQKLVDKIENDRANLNARVAKLAKRQEDFQLCRMAVALRQARCKPCNLYQSSRGK